MIKRIYLEITNECNLRCPFCTNGKGHSFMSLLDFDNYTSQIKRVCDYIYLHVLGEPTMHENFEEMLNILDKKEFNLQLVTNGTLLNKYPNLLKHTCLRKLSVSVHSISNTKMKNEYFEYIDYLIEHHEDKYLELRFYNLSNLDDELKNYVNKLSQRYNLTLTSKEKSYMIKDKVYLYFEDLFKWPSIKDSFVSNLGKCQGIKNQLAILHDGTVTSCCLDPLGYNSFGNLKKESLEEILNGQKYLSTLNNLKNNQFSLELCKRCTYRLRFDKGN